MAHAFATSMRRCTRVAFNDLFLAPALCTLAWSAPAAPARAPSTGGLVSYVANFDQDSGYVPDAGLVRASDGNFYGTTTVGGTNFFGTIFRLSPAGEVSVVYSFDPSVDGTVTYPLMQASDGALWGTMSSGGADGCGEVFRLTLDGVFSDMHDFACNANGESPAGGLVEGERGRLYGVTQYGGVNNYGIVYRISMGFKFKVVALFDLSTGINPQGTLLSDGPCVYGTTSQGGQTGLGTLWRLCDGYVEPTMLHFFAAAEGYGAHGGLIFSASEGHDKRILGTLANSIFSYDLGTRQLEAAKTHAQTSPLVLGPDRVTTYATALAPGRTEHSAVVAFDGQLHETRVAYLAGIAPLTSPLVLSPKGGLWGVTQFAPRAQGGRAFKVTGY